MNLLTPIGLVKTTLKQDKGFTIIVYPTQDESKNSIIKYVNRPHCHTNVNHVFVLFTILHVNKT